MLLCGNEGMDSAKYTTHLGPHWSCLVTQENSNWAKTRVPTLRALLWGLRGWPNYLLWVRAEFPLSQPSVDACACVK